MRSLLPVPVLMSFALACLLAAGPAPAEDEAAKSPPNRCRAEVDKLCSDSKPGTVERRECVRNNVDKLPEDCRPTRRGGPAGLQAMMAACGADIEAHCADVRSGGGRIARCLRTVDADKLSSACSEQLEAMAGPPPEKGAPTKTPPEAD